MMGKKKISNLEDHLGYWFRCLSNLVHTSFSNKLSECDISVAQWVVLRILYDGEEFELNQVPKRIGLDKSTISRMIDRLVHKGLVHRLEGKDRRSSNITLSSKALEFIPKLAALADENDNTFFQYLTAAEQDNLLNLIKKLLDANGWHASKGGREMLH
jgi:DNA-binding MarR family transcriptional regulator